MLTSRPDPSSAALPPSVRRRTLRAPSRSLFVLGASLALIGCGTLDLGRASRADGDVGRGARGAPSQAVPTPDAARPDVPASALGRDAARTAPVPAAPTAPAAPALDGDADGVPDAVDRCPDTGAGEPVDEIGCGVLGGVIEGVDFASGSDTLDATAEEVLAGIAATLREYPAVDVAVEAHTDNRGPAGANLELASRRALAVARYLAAEGVAPARIRPRAHGESSPRANNASAEGRARNRRVEMVVVE